MINANYFDAIVFHENLPNLSEHNCQKVDNLAIQIWLLSVFKVLLPLLENPVHVPMLITYSVARQYAYDFLSFRSSEIDEYFGLRSKNI